MTDAEWAVFEPVVSAPAWLAGRGGRPSQYCRRDVVDAIRYLTHNGPVWRALSADFPPPWRVYYWASTWQQDGATARTHDDLRYQVRVVAGRSPAPTAAIIDSQSVKGSEMVAWARRGYDAGKKINGTKRHLAVDVLGLLLTVLVTAASVQDLDTFQVLPRRWVIGRTLSWITRHRRTVRDYERHPAHHETHIYWAMIIVMTRRLARQPPPSREQPKNPPAARSLAPRPAIPAPAT